MPYGKKAVFEKKGYYTLLLEAKGNKKKKKALDKAFDDAASSGKMTRII